MNKAKAILVSFFKGLKCTVIDHETYCLVKNVPIKIQKILKIHEEEKFSFIEGVEGKFIDDKNELFIKIRDYIKNESSKTLLRIDFDFPQNIQEKVNLRNCSIAGVQKNQENNYFSRFTFLTTFRSLNKVEQVLNEIFVHGGEIVKGDLKDYKVQEGKPQEASTEHVSKEYGIAKNHLKEVLIPNINEISKTLNLALNNEKKRVEDHYNRITQEYKLNREKFLARLEESKRNKDEPSKIKKLIDYLDKNYSIEGLKKIEKEFEEVIINEKTKYSLNIENKLINTTIIYYPIFKIHIILEENGYKKGIELVYNPLTNQITKLECDSCKSPLEEINICHGGHICCSSCLHLCPECGKRFCKDCFVGTCGTCGKLVCKNCAIKCQICKETLCPSCVRIKSKTGREICSNCVVYCNRCSKPAEKKRLIRSKLDNFMVCEECYREERRKKGFV